MKKIVSMLLLVVLLMSNLVFADFTSIDKDGVLRSTKESMQFDNIKFFIGSVVNTDDNILRLHIRLETDGISENTPDNLYFWILSTEDVAAIRGMNDLVHVSSANIDKTETDGGMYSSNEIGFKLTQIDGLPKTSSKIFTAYTTPSMDLWGKLIARKNLKFVYGLSFQTIEDDFELFELSTYEEAYNFLKNSDKTYFIDEFYLNEIYGGDPFEYIANPYDSVANTTVTNTSTDYNIPPITDETEASFRRNFNRKLRTTFF